MCARGVKGEGDCFGDSGRPLVGFVGGQPMVAGIVSYGVGCANESPGAYAQINAPDIASFI